MKKLENHSLEFHTGQGYQWHIREDNDRPSAPDYGWRLIAHGQHHLKLSSFVNYLEEHLPPRLTLDTVIKLWAFFDYAWEHRYSPTDAIPVEELEAQLLQ